MSNKRRKFSSEFKVKLVLEVLKNEKTLNQNKRIAFYDSKNVS